MILKREELALIRRGRTWLTLSRDPGWSRDQVVRLHASSKDEQASASEREGFLVTIRRVLEDDGRYQVLFTYGDGRPERRYLADGWPDYTSDASRAMPDELPPMPETPEERKDRSTWLEWVIGKNPLSRRSVVPRATVRWVPYCKHCGAPLRVPQRPEGASPAPLPTFCSDTCVLLESYARRRNA